MAGIRAARLAQAGLTGPSTVFEGRKGFCRVFSRDAHPERLTSALGQQYLISKIGFKLYNCCYFIHPAIEALHEIVEQHGLLPGDIQSVRVGTSAHAVTHVGAITHPGDAVGGQFSLAFTLGLALLRGTPDISSYTAEQLADPELHRFADRVTVCEDPEATARYPASWGCIVEVTTTSGARHECRVAFQRGTPENPASPEDLWQKFQHNVSPILGSSAAERIGQLLTDVRGLSTLDQLGGVLA
jgi:2-methylcitrate dehydratase PrpD